MYCRPWVVARRVNKILTQKWKPTCCCSASRLALKELREKLQVYLFCWEVLNGFLHFRGWQVADSI